MRLKRDQQDHPDEDSSIENLKIPIYDWSLYDESKIILLVKMLSSGIPF